MFRIHLWQQTRQLVRTGPRRNWHSRIRLFENVPRRLRCFLRLFRGDRAYSMPRHIRGLSLLLVLSVRGRRS